MRLNSVFLGAVAIVVAALIHDTAFSAPPAKPFVNWETVQESTRGAFNSLREQWVQDRRRVAPAGRPAMVNWDVAATTWNELGADMRAMPARVHAALTKRSG